MLFRCIKRSNPSGKDELTRVFVLYVKLKERYGSAGTRVTWERLGLVSSDAR